MRQRDNPLFVASTFFGYTFDGWFTNPSGGTALTSPYTLTGSITLYAQWTATSHTVTFDANGVASDRPDLTRT